MKFKPLFSSTNTSSGFTLIELLLIITLGAISLGVTSNILLSLLNSYNKTNAITEVEQQANFVASKLEKELKNASSVSSPTPQRLSFNLNGVTIYYNIANNNIYRSTSPATWSTNSVDALIATPAINQTNSGIIIQCISGTNCFTVSGTSPKVVDISVVFRQSTNSEVIFGAEVNVKNTIILRNSY